MVIGICLSVVISVLMGISASTVYAQSIGPKTVLSRSPLQQINQYFSTQTIMYSDGTMLDRNIISGPPLPPSGNKSEHLAVALPEPNKAMAANILTVPAFRWVFGCAAVSAAMIAGYYDRNGFPNMYAGPTDNGVMPIVEDASWGNWTDSVFDTYPNNPLVASHNGLDGRTTNGSIDDYWFAYLSDDDPYATGHWKQHIWWDSIGDFMKTSQSKYGNTDGSTTFWSYTASASPFYCNDMETDPDPDVYTTDGTVGRKLFYDARGYVVTDCYNQKTDNIIPGGFSFIQYKVEIDAGHPVLINVMGHSMVGVGYDDSSNTVYLHNTWDNSNHTMTWGGSYEGMSLWGVSIVHLQAPEPPSIVEGTLGTELTINGADFGTKKGKVLIGGVTAKIASGDWTPTQITLTISKPPPSVDETYPVVVMVNKFPSTYGHTFTLKKPVLDILPVTSGKYGDLPITITGMFFGTKKGKLYLEHPDTLKKKNLKITNWRMTASTGESTATFLLPKISRNWPASTYPLKLSNKVGTTDGTDFTLEALP